MQDTAKPAFTRHQYEFAAHIRDPGHNPAPAGIEDRRLNIYRELLYNNVEGFLSSGFPVIRELLDDESWHALVRNFFSRHHCHTPLFMEIPREFLNYLENERADRCEDMPFLRELAHYEWVELALSIAQDEDRPLSIDSDGDLVAGIPVLSSLAWPLSYRFPVHRISPAFRPDTPPEQPSYLLVYRDTDDDVGFIELNAVSARLFALLQEDSARSGRQVLEQIASELRHPDPDTVINGGFHILREWRERGIVLGTAT